MAGVQDQMEIKFRLFDGSDIGPKTYPAAASVATLKESILADWPKEKGQLPKTVSDVKLISAGKVLENNRTVGECLSPLLNIPGGVTTMHVLVKPPTLDKGIYFSFPLILGRPLTMPHAVLHFTPLLLGGGPTYFVSFADEKEPNRPRYEAGKATEPEQMYVCDIVMQSLLDKLVVDVDLEVQSKASDLTRRSAIMQN